MSRAFSRFQTRRPLPKNLIALFNQLVDKQALTKLQQLRKAALKTLGLYLTTNPRVTILAR